ncbi:helix-turn-helix domain-containing protein [Plantactinospora sp. KBS50]|uniref:helix-turn-helix domain-containing protein n=1 Tax=Plantactinospora sp. KBS50 TaxID=2024580 RepID=UPI001E3F8746|nr:helix-turn-helix domain-containing protein [Plantactinospora sp. KBS50]
MRYPDGGGLSARGRAKREAVRREAAGWFAEDVSVPEIARRLRVSQTAVYGWRKRWRAGGEQALASRGLVGLGVGWMRVGCGGWPKPWSRGRRRTGSVVISGGPWPGCRT